MRYKKRGPCKDFDMEEDYARVGARCHGSTSCDYYATNITEDEMKHDAQAPCRRRETIEEDIETMEMF